MQERPDIQLILESYGFHDVPTGYSWRNLRCEFHGDRNASAQVNTDEGFYRCFTCDFWGDGYAVIQWREGIGFRDAVKYAEGLAGAHDNSSGGAPGSGRGVSGGAWYQRGVGQKGKTRVRYNGTYSR